MPKPRKMCWCGFLVEADHYQITAKYLAEDHFLWASSFSILGVHLIVIKVGIWVGFALLSFGEKEVKWKLELLACSQP